MTVIFGDRQTEWDGDSLALLTARLRAPLEHRLCKACLQPRKRRNGGTGRWTGAFDYCRGCYIRWDDAGRPETGPPPPMSRQQIAELGQAAMRAKKVTKATGAAKISAANDALDAKTAGRMEDFAFLREHNVPVVEAGARVGAGPRTAERYEKLRLAGEISGHMGYDDEGEMAA